MPAYHSSHTYTVPTPLASLSTLAPLLSSSRLRPKRQRQPLKGTGSLTIHNHRLETYKRYLSLTWSSGQTSLRGTSESGISRHLFLPGHITLPATPGKSLKTRTPLSSTPSSNRAAFSRLLLVAAAFSASKLRARRNHMTLLLHVFPPESCVTPFSRQLYHVIQTHVHNNTHSMINVLLARGSYNEWRWWG